MDELQVMLSFQHVMAKFLDTQRAVMLNYLGSEDVQEVTRTAELNNAPHVSRDGDGASLSIQRGLVQLVEAPLTPAAVPMIPSGAVLLTDDGDGLAQRIADRLAARLARCSPLSASPSRLSSLPAASNFLEGSIAPHVFAKGLLLALAVGLMGGLYPAYRAWRLLPSEGLRHD